MFYYVKFTALSIKTICRALSLLVLKILASPRAILRIPGYFAHLLQHLKMKENDNSENSMIKNNPSLV